MLHGDRPSAARRCALKAVTQVGVGVHGKNNLITLQSKRNPHCNVPLGKSGLPPFCKTKGIEKPFPVCAEDKFI